MSPFWGTGVGQSGKRGDVCEAEHARRVAARPGGEVPVFFFYNSRWGCVMSLVVSAALTLLLLILLGWI